MSPQSAPEPDMINAQRLIGEIRRELGPVEQEIRRHPYLSALEAGRVRQEDLTHFAGEQHHIIRSDLRSVALLVNRFGRRRAGRSSRRCWTGSWRRWRRSGPSRPP